MLQAQDVEEYERFMAQAFIRPVNTTDSAERVPADVWGVVFTFLPIETVIRVCEKLSKHIKSACSNRLYKTLVTRILIEKGQALPGEPPKNWKDAFRQRVFKWDLEKFSKTLDTPGSINSLFSDFFREFWRGISGGVRDYLGEILEGF